MLKHYVIYWSGVENVVEFSTRAEAEAWAAKCCRSTRHRIVSE